MHEWEEDIRRRLAGLKLPPAREAEIVEELAQHLEDRYQELVIGGATEDEARRAALEELSDEDLLARGLRRVEQEVKQEPIVPGGERRNSFVASIWQDVRYGLRQVRRTPGFTIVAVLTLGLGIAANTTIFSAVSAVLLRKPPVKDPDHLITVSSKNIVRGSDLVKDSAPDFESWKGQNHVFMDMAAADTGRSITLTGHGEPESLDGDRVTANYFNVIGVLPAVGRAFLPSEGQAGNDHVVILSDALWHARFGSDPNSIGEEIEIDHERYTVVGVMPREASMPMPWMPPRLWTPLVFSAKDVTPSARGDHDLDMVLGRLKPGVSLAAAQAEMNSIAHRLAQSYPETNKDWGVTVLTLQEYLIRKPQGRTVFMILMVMVGLVLLLACANIAGLLLARAAARAHEMAVRTAVGASRLRLIRQMLMESLLIGMTGGVAGLVMSVWGINLLRAGFNFNSVGRQMAEHIHLDQRTLLFTAAISFLTTILFGLLPAIRASKVNPGDALSESGRTGSSSFTRTRLRSVLVTAEIALALALLAGADVMMREIRREFTMDKGFTLDNVLLAEINLKSRQYEKPDAQITFFQEAIQRVRELPGVDSSSATTATPLEGSWSTPFSIIGQPPLPDSERPRAQGFVVGPDYFRTMQIPLMKGRTFSSSDNSGAPGVAIVNQEFARRFFPNGDEIGHQIELDDGHHRRVQIVGVVGNVLAYFGQLTPNPQIYESALQIPLAPMRLVLRSRAAPSAIAPMLRRAVWSVDKNQPVGRIETMKDVADGSAGGDKLIVALMGIFAALALVLAAVGIYGVIAYSVSQRTREVGIRMALGAHKKDILRLVLRQGGLLTGIGCMVGFCLAVPLPRVFAGLFPEFPPQGPVVAIAVALIIAIVSLLATYVPASRATKVDPMVALRYE